MDILDDSAEGMELEELREYQALMEFPIEALANAAGFSKKLGEVDDHYIVERAAHKIGILKKMLIASGFSGTMLDAIMEED